MRFISLILLVTAMPVWATMNMKPGLWSVQVEVENNGKKINVSNEIAQAMAKMSPEQRKKMQEMMGNMANDQGGTQTCFTQDMLTPEKMLKQQSNKKCDMKLTTNTPAVMVGSFTCVDGTKGDMKWETSSDKMKGIINTVSPKRGKAVMNIAGKFVASDCGKIKPPTAL